ncbi:dihydrofolate reductase [Companilactobacillus sp. RD055328]|uniref:dihydrofolate reductase family protein n=1 Tax=Companilactobacillus sp. RD055328 TaxID=2916634 RepID=UPI001FC8C76A|nr:dihydrofolate reductase family protein [Companilactobacillus sp. RD055328]GKQ43350.1 dihydrofolate reductase [Companilactobacillus sp. RD055328]
MRKIMFYGAISLDGFLSDSNDNLQWLFDANLDGKSTYEEFISTVDTIIMGRVTYEETTKLMNGQALYPNHEKFVLTHDKNKIFDQAKAISNDLIEFVTELREQEGGDIWIVGGGSIVTSLLKADLIDEWRIQIAPYLLGRGKRLFQEDDYFKKLNLVGTTNLGELTELHFTN